MTAGEYKTAGGQRKAVLEDIWRSTWRAMGAVEVVLSSVGCDLSSVRPQLPAPLVAARPRCTLHQRQRHLLILWHVFIVVCHLLTRHRLLHAASQSAHNSAKKCGS